MGLSVSAASAIFALGFILMMVVVVDSFTDSFQELDDAAQDRNERDGALRDTRITIESVRHFNASKTVMINVTNSGSVSLDPEALDVLIDGMLLTGNITNATVDGSPAGAWFPDKMLVVEMDCTPVPGRVKVVTGLGVADYTDAVTELG